MLYTYSFASFCMAEEMVVVVVCSNRALSCKCGGMCLFLCACVSVSGCLHSSTSVQWLSLSIEKCIFPSDFKASGCITDDELFDTLVSPLPKGIVALVLIASC